MISRSLVSLAACWSCLTGAAEVPVIGSALSTTQEEQALWWSALPVDEQLKLASVFDDSWWNSIDGSTQIAYASLTATFYEFLASGADSHAADSYQGFAPLLLRTSFHSSGTFHNPTGTGGSNGGTIFHHAELDDANNGCIDIATDQLYALFHGHQVPLADAVVIGGVVALDSMDFPRMDLVKIQGGRKDYVNVAFRDRLPSPDDDPLMLFMSAYGFTEEELVALVGGSHNFGAAHGKCSGYEGQWTHSPLNWFDVDGGAPAFFTDLLLEDWKWYEVCTFQNDTSSYLSIEDPFANGIPEEEEEEEAEVDVVGVANSLVPLICEEQAMRGCSFADGVYPTGTSPCATAAQPSLLHTFRLKSDFFLKKNPALLPHAEAFAADADKLATQFGIAYHKLTHNGLERCGHSGHGCDVGSRCETMLDDTTGDFLYETCAVRHTGDGGRGGDGDRERRDGGGNNGNRNGGNNRGLRESPSMKRGCGFS